MQLDLTSHSSMADDYIGKKMDDYRRAAVSMKKARKSSAPTYLRRGYVQVPFEPITAVVVEQSDMAQWVEAIVGELRSIDCRVALVSPHSRAAIAQATGCRYYPIHADERLDEVTEAITSHWGKISMQVILSEERICVNKLIVRGDEPESVARVLRCLAELGDIRIFAENSEIVVKR